MRAAAASLLGIHDYSTFMDVRRPAGARYVGSGRPAVEGVVCHVLVIALHNNGV